MFTETVETELKSFIPKLHHFKMVKKLTQCVSIKNKLCKNNLLQLNQILNRYWILEI